MPRTPDPKLQARILEAARKLFAQGGEHKLSMRALARQAGTNTPAVYRRFRDRAAILDALVQQFRQNAFAVLQPCRSPEEMAHAMLGLALSSLARSTEQVLPMLVVAIMVSMVLAGGLIPVTGRLLLDQTSWLVPARWGFSAAASTVDLNNVEAGLPADRLWRHVRGSWLFDMGMLVVLAVVFTGIVRFRLRLRARS